MEQGIQTTRVEVLGTVLASRASDEGGHMECGAFSDRSRHLGGALILMLGIGCQGAAAPDVTGLDGNRADSVLGKEILLEPQSERWGGDDHEPQSSFHFGGDTW